MLFIQITKIPLFAYTMAMAVAPSLVSTRAISHFNRTHTLLISSAWRIVNNFGFDVPQALRIPNYIHNSIPTSARGNNLGDSCKFVQQILSVRPSKVKPVNTSTNIPKNTDILYIRCSLRSISLFACECSRVRVYVDSHFRRFPLPLFDAWTLCSYLPVCYCFCCFSW